jgi:sugar phosphate isomerase/epimerase
VYAHGADPHALAKEAERWIGVAVALGSPTITIALSGDDSPDAAIAAQNLAPTVEMAHSRGIRVLFHNDDMRREPAEILTAVIQKLGHDRTGTCPDFGNFATKSAAYALSQLRMLAPFASNICHSKDGIADKGKFYADDFPASMKVMQDAGFQGLYSLEFEGLGAPLDGLKKLLDLTLQYLT